MPEMEQIAESRGRRRLLFINEKQGNPASLSFFEDEWLWPEISLAGAKIPESKPKGRAPESVSLNASDKTGKEIGELFLAEAVDDADCELVASKNSIEFLVRGKPSGLVLRISGLRRGAKD